MTDSLGTAIHRPPGEIIDVRFTPKSGHWLNVSGCPLCAKSGHDACLTFPPLEPLSASLTLRIGKIAILHFQIEGGTTDDFQHVGCGRLLLKRVAQLIEQPRVLDGDDGLSGEVRQQCNLLICEGANLLAVDVDHTDDLIVLEHRHNDKAARSCYRGEAVANRMVLAGWVTGCIGDLHRPFGVYCPL